jgi:hypothetical protein
MTIRKGEPWGEPGPLPPDGVVVHSDIEARAVITEARRASAPIPTLGLLGGDLARTCGAMGSLDRLHSDDAQTLPVDLCEVLVDGSLHFFVAHLVARRSWLHGPLVLVMNAQYRGDWNVAPRSHPNDGKVEVFSGNPSLGDRWKALPRLKTGTHVPHPDIFLERTSGIQVDLTPGTKVWLDGETVGAARTLSIRVVPDALTVVV